MPAPAAPLLQHLFCNFSAGYLLLNFPVATAQLVYSLPNRSCRRLPHLYCNFFSMPFPPRLFCRIGLIEPFYAGVFAVHLYCLIDPTGCLRYRIGPDGVCRIFTATFLQLFFYAFPAATFLPHRSHLNLSCRSFAAQFSFIISFTETFLPWRSHRCLCCRSAHSGTSAAGAACDKWAGNIPA